MDEEEMVSSSKFHAKTRISNPDFDQKFETEAESGISDLGSDLESEAETLSGSDPDQEFVTEPEHPRNSFQINQGDLVHCPDMADDCWDTDPVRIIPIQPSSDDEGINRDNKPETRHVQHRRTKKIERQPKTITIESYLCDLCSETVNIGERLKHWRLNHRRHKLSTPIFTIQRYEKILSESSSSSEDSDSIDSGLALSSNATCIFSEPLPSCPPLDTWDNLQLHLKNQSEQYGFPPPKVTTAEMAKAEAIRMAEMERRNALSLQRQIVKLNLGDNNIGMGIRLKEETDQTSAHFRGAEVRNPKPKISTRASPTSTSQLIARLRGFTLNQPIASPPSSSTDPESEPEQQCSPPKVVTAFQMMKNRKRKHVEMEARKAEDSPQPSSPVVGTESVSLSSPPKPLQPLPTLSPTQSPPVAKFPKIINRTGHLITQTVQNGSAGLQLIISSAVPTPPKKSATKLISPPRPRPQPLLASGPGTGTGFYILCVSPKNFTEAKLPSSCSENAKFSTGVGMKNLDKK